jgi:hypothetical protein
VEDRVSPARRRVGHPAAVLVVKAHGDRAIEPQIRPDARRGSHEISLTPPRFVQSLPSPRRPFRGWLRPPSAGLRPGGLSTDRHARLSWAVQLPHGIQLCAATIGRPSRTRHPEGHARSERVGRSLISVDSRNVVARFEVALHELRV